MNPLNESGCPPWNHARLTLSVVLKSLFFLLFEHIKLSYTESGPASHLVQIFQLQGNSSSASDQATIFITTFSLRIFWLEIVWIKPGAFCIPSVCSTIELIAFPLLKIFCPIVVWIRLLVQPCRYLSTLTGSSFSEAHAMDLDETPPTPVSFKLLVYPWWNEQTWRPVFFSLFLPHLHQFWTKTKI